MARRIPEIFIIGTMRGGTTILYDYICTHPRVLPGAQKEIHYFSMYPMRDLDWYLSQFPDRPDDHLSIDASPTYFDTATIPTIPAYIHKAAPSARIILIVRDPVERAISHFQHLRLVSHKDLFADIDINEFLSRPLERCHIRKDPSDYHLGLVLGFSVYDNKLTHYVRAFGRHNILVLTNESLRSDPQDAMRRVFAHCGLEWVPSPMFGVQGYLSGSQNLPVDRDVRARLEAILYPSYERFLLGAGLPAMDRPTVAPVTV